MFIMQNNTIFSRHLVATMQQPPGEKLDKYLQTLKTLSRDYDFRALT